MGEVWGKREQLKAGPQTADGHDSPEWPVRMSAEKGKRALPQGPESSGPTRLKEKWEMPGQDPGHFALEGDFLHKKKLIIFYNCIGIRMNISVL